MFCKKFLRSVFFVCPTPLCLFPGKNRSLLAGQPVVQPVEVVVAPLGAVVFAPLGAAVEAVVQPARLEFARLGEVAEVEVPVEEAVVAPLEDPVEAAALIAEVVSAEENPDFAKLETVLPSGHFFEFLVP